MRLLLFVLAFFSVVLFAGLAAAPPKKTTLRLTADGLAEGSSIPRLYTCDGKNVSPPLTWSREPEGTQSFALILDDPDAGDFTHWLLWDIPASVHSLAEGAKAEGVSGGNDFGDRGYGGPCPPGGTHSYSFRLFALDVPSLHLDAAKGRNALDQAMGKHVLAKTEYRLHYGRN